MIGVARRAQHDRHDGGPALGAGKRPVAVMPLGPSDAKAAGRSPDHRGDIHLDLLVPDARERIIEAGIIVKRLRTRRGCEIIGAEPVLPDHHRIGGQGADVVDELRQIPGDLRIGGHIGRCRGGHDLRLPQPVDLHDPRRDGAARGLPDQPYAKACGQKQGAERHEPPVTGLDAGGADPFIPRLRCLLIRCHRFGRGPVACGRATEHRPHSFSDRSMEEDPPPPSAERMTCAASAAWAAALRRFIFCAQRGE